MAVDVNSTEYKRGKLGEKIVIDILRGWRAHVTRPNGAPAEEDSSDLMDFKCVPMKNSAFAPRYVEVKVRSGTMPYAHGQYSCYLFPVVQIEAYEKYCAKNRLHGELWIVDTSESIIMIGHLVRRNSNFAPKGIGEKIWIDGKQFPFDQNTSRGMMRFFHRKQFADIYSLNDVEIDMFSRGEFPILSNALIDYINREFCHISSRFCHMYPGEKNIAKYIPLGVVKKLADLEKEFGTFATVNAIATENIIDNCSVEEFLFLDYDYGTFEYICKFAHENVDDDHIEETARYGSCILEWKNAHYGN